MTGQIAIAAEAASAVPIPFVADAGVGFDGRPILTIPELKAMGWTACMDGQVMLLTASEANRRAPAESRATGAFTGMSERSAGARARRWRT